MIDTNDLRPLIRAALEAGDKSGGVQLRDGTEVVIYTADALGPLYPIHGYALNSADLPAAWKSNGGAYITGAPSPYDLIPRPAPKRRVKVWVNVNIGFDGRVYGGVYPGKYGADRCSTGDRIACIEIDCEEGQGL